MAFSMNLKFKRKHRKVKHTSNKNPHYRIITYEEPNSIAAESFRRVKVGLEYAEVDKKIQVIQLCSAVQGEGKTTTGLNVAATYVEEHKKVLVIDLDFRRPKLHRTVGIQNVNGITDYLAGNITKDEMIKHHPIGMDIINRGTKVPYPTAILGSKGLSDLIGELRNEYDIIIIDCPPILAVSDSIVVSKLCDGALYVVSQMRTEKTAAREAVSVLKNANIRLLGVVFTEVTSKSSNYYNSKYKYYYQNYYGYQKNDGTHFSDQNANNPLLSPENEEDKESSPETPEAGTGKEETKAE